VFPSFESFYASELQAIYLPCVAPAAFLGWLATSGRETRRGVEPSAAGFMRAYAAIFAIETILDPLITGPAVAWLDVGEHFFAVLLPFVLLGDFRVFLLVFMILEPGRGAASAALRAAAWTLAVPVVAGATYAALDAVRGPLPGQVLWILYEAAFLALVRWLRTEWLPRRIVPERIVTRAYLERVLDYVALYYALWAASDALILFAGLDAGWGLRAVPNLLYYGLWVPYTYVLFFAGPPVRLRRPSTRRLQAAAAR